MAPLEPIEAGTDGVPASSPAPPPTPTVSPPSPAVSPPTLPACPPLPPPELPLSELEFTGCQAVPMTYAQLRRYEGRLEVWDAASETAWMVREPTSDDHEAPSHGLVGLLALIAAVRGSPIKCSGSMDLVVRDESGERRLPRRIMQADQAVYLHPARVELSDTGVMVVGRHSYPDVVLEVDHTTDVRRGKLKLYESWGFPELWVEVPDRWVASRPGRLVPGLTIHLLEGGVYRESPESVAFPGWTAEAIHEAMNEPKRSVRTSGILERVGRVLGKREGTGPEDDPFSRSLMRQGERKGRAEGQAEGRAATLAKFARRILLSRGVDVSDDYLAAPVFAASSEDAVFEAATACTDEAGFLAALRVTGE